MSGESDWVVYITEDNHGTTWLFWCDRIEDWVSDLKRATRYTWMQAANCAEWLSEDPELPEVRTIRASQVQD